MLFLAVFILALFAELIDSALGMMYGTLLSPLLIIIGFDPLVVVPSILFSQAIGGMIAAIKHHRYGNVDFHFSNGDFKSFLALAVPGLVAVLLGVFVALNIPGWALKGYIAIIVLLVALIILFRVKIAFSWKKMGLIGSISSFNKALSGGGFGPFLTGGQIAIGQKSKSAIGITTLTEVPICMGSFLLYFIFNGFTEWNFLALLTVGSITGAMIGPKITKRVKERDVKILVGVLALLLGGYMIVKILFGLL